jgi:hypothetical protein
MKTILLMMSTLFLFACGGTTTQGIDDLMRSASPVVTSQYSAINAYLDLPAGVQDNAIGFCHPVFMSGHGANDRAPKWPGTTVPKWGGELHQFGSNGTGSSIEASPNYLSGPPTSDGMMITTQCEAVHNFGTSAQILQQTKDTDYYRLWGTGSGPGFVSSDFLMWGNSAFCFLESVNSLSYTNEKVRIRTVDVSGWTTWKMLVEGYPTLGAGAKCVLLDRQHATTRTVQATPATGPVNMGLATGAGICLISEISGNLDGAYPGGDSYVRIFDAWGSQWLEVIGDLSYASGYCVYYS